MWGDLFDVLVVAVSIPTMTGTELPPGADNLRILRAFRVLRLFKLVRLYPNWVLNQTGL